MPKKIPSWAELMHSTSVINKTRKDLLYKKKFFKQSQSYLTDPNMLKAAIWNYAVEPVKTWSCPHCNLSIQCPKQWILQHIKTHERNPEDRKENHIVENKINPYFY